MSIPQTQGFVISSTDDPMETEADRRAGQAEIIDIDLDLAEEQQHDREDEYMSEDIDAFNHQGSGIMQTDVAYNDDEMVDDDVAENDIVYDASIQDDVLLDAEQMITVEPDEDDEIIDLENNEPLPVPEAQENQQHRQSNTNKDSADNPIEDQLFRSGPAPEFDNAQRQQYFGHEVEESQNRDVLEPSGEQEPEFSSHQDSILDSQKIKTQDLSNDSSLNPDTDSKYLGDNAEHPTDALSESVGYAPSNSHTTGDHRPEERDQGINDREASDYRIRSTSGSELPSVPLPTNNLDQNELIDHHDEPSGATTYVHPVVVIYQGTEISLFRPIDGDQDFILEDENFANDSISNLLAGCRPVLGEDVDGQEMVIHVVDLDLQICEFSKSASITTISQLTDIYLQLQNFDGNDNPPDLRLMLSAQPSPTHRLDVLRNALIKGKGLSETKLPGGGVGDYGRFLDGQRGKYEDERAASSILRPVESSAISEPKSPRIRAVSAVNNEQVPQIGSRNTDVPDVIEKADDGTHEEQKRKHDYVLKTKDQYFEQSLLSNAKSVAVDAPSESETQFQHGEEPVLPDDKEDTINYEDGTIGTESSSGSSTLHGDTETINQAHPSSRPPDSTKEEAVLGTDSSSYTLEESSHDLTSEVIHANEETDDLYNAKEGNESVEDPPERETVENLQPQDDNLGKAVKENGETFTQSEETSTKNDRLNIGDHQDGDDDTATDGDYERTSKAQRDEFKDDPSRKLHYEDFVADDERDYVEDTVDLDQKGLHHQSGSQHLQEEKQNPEEQFEQFEDNSNSLGEDEGPNTNAIDEQRAYEHDLSDGTDSRAPLHHAADTEDNDEITYGNEDEDAISRSKVPTFERDDVPSPRPLKRSRGHFDADKNATEDSQDAKRTRST